MPARSLQCAGFALFHSSIWFRNGLLSFISPELFCTLLLCAHEGIFLEGSEGFQCRAVTAELLSQAPRALGLALMVGISLGGIRRGSHCHPGLEGMQQCIRCAWGTSTATSPPSWALKGKTASVPAGQAGPRLGPAFPSGHYTKPERSKCSLEASSDPQIY